MSAVEKVRRSIMLIPSFSGPGAVASAADCTGWSASSAGVSPALENLTTPLRSANVTYYGAASPGVDVTVEPATLDVQACWGVSNA